MRTSKASPVLVVVLLAIAGCGRNAGTSSGQPPTSSGQPPTSSTMGSSSPARAVAADSALPPSLLPAPPAEASAALPAPTPATPPGADPERVLLASSICAAAYDPTTMRVGCRSHPPFERPEQKPDGKLLAHTDDPLSLCSIDRIFRGSFTRPGAKQALLGFGQCKDRDGTWDSGFPGSAVLVEEIGGRWQAVDYEADVSTDACVQDHRADGRDVLLCHSNLMTGRMGSVFFVFLLDFGRPGKHAATLARMFADDMLCAGVDEPTPVRQGFIALRITSVSLADLNKDGTGDLVVRVTRARAAPSPALDAQVRAVCKRNPSATEKAILPPAKESTLQFLSDGAHFAASPATRRVLDRWTAESPEGFNGLSAVGPPDLVR